jgi:hypothetical protein
MSRKAIDYSSPPNREKNCDFLFPSDPRNSKFTTLVLTPPSTPLPFEVRAGFINDASCLNKTAIFGVIKVQTIEDVSRALSFARANHLKFQ